MFLKKFFFKSPTTLFSSTHKHSHYKISFHEAGMTKSVLSSYIFLTFLRHRPLSKYSGFTFHLKLRKLFCAIPFTIYGFPVTFSMRISISIDRGINCRLPLFSIFNNSMRAVAFLFLWPFCSYWWIIYKLREKET